MQMAQIHKNGKNPTDDALRSLTRGTIDIHIHSNPHSSGKKALNALQAVEQACEAEMAAIVLKCNFFPTGGLAYILSQVIKNFKVFGGIVLNASIGGINRTAVERAIFYGEGNPGEFTKVIWMPTFSAATDVVFNHRAVTEKVEVLRNGQIVPELIPIFDLIAKYNLVLATGHLGEEEALAVVKAAKQQGVSKIILTHPWGVVPGISVEGQKQAVELGAMLEICYVDTTGYYKEKYGHSLSNKEVAALIREVGPESIVLSTDLGADPGVNPLPALGMGLFIEALRNEGLSEKEVEIMSKKNPAALLGLDFA